VSTLVRACSVNDVDAESAIPVEVPLDGGNGSTLELAIVHSNGAFYAIYD
jgi:nitrite reductase/ring-hydroxylating ferredoxin subunit